MLVTRKRLNHVLKLERISFMKESELQFDHALDSVSIINDIRAVLKLAAEEKKDRE